MAEHALHFWWSLIYKRFIWDGNRMRSKKARKLRAESMFVRRLSKKRKNNVTVKCTSIKCLFRFFFVIRRWECDKEEMIRAEDIKCGAWRDVAKIYCKNMNYEGSRRKGMDSSIHLLPVPRRHHRPRLLLHNSETNSSVIDQRGRLDASLHYSLS